MSLQKVEKYLESVDESYPEGFDIGKFRKEQFRLISVLFKEYSVEVCEVSAACDKLLLKANEFKSDDSRSIPNIVCENSEVIPHKGESITHFILRGGDPENPDILTKFVDILDAMMKVDYCSPPTHQYDKNVLGEIADHMLVLWWFYGCCRVEIRLESIMRVGLSAQKLTNVVCLLLAAAPEVKLRLKQKAGVQQGKHHQKKETERKVLRAYQDLSPNWLSNTGKRAFLLGKDAFTFNGFIKEMWKKMNENDDEVFDPKTIKNHLLSLRKDGII